MVIEEVVEEKQEDSNFTVLKIEEESESEEEIQEEAKEQVKEVEDVKESEESSPVLEVSD